MIANEATCRLAWIGVEQVVLRNDLNGLLGGSGDFLKQVAQVGVGSERRKRLPNQSGSGVPAASNAGRLSRHEPRRSEGSDRQGLAG